MSTGRAQEKDSDVKYLTYPFYAGGNRGRGQVYPTGDKSNVNVFGATQAGQITEITKAEKGESTIVITNTTGTQTSQIVPAGLTLLVKQGDIVPKYIFRRLPRNPCAKNTPEVIWATGDFLVRPRPA